jgi:hypothetical protein
MLAEDVEALAHLDQAIFFHATGGRSFLVFLESTKLVLDHGMAIAGRIKSNGDRRVTLDQKETLYRRVRDLRSVGPMWPFVRTMNP